MTNKPVPAIGQIWHCVHHSADFKFRIEAKHPHGFYTCLVIEAKIPFLTAHLGALITTANPSINASCTFIPASEDWLSILEPHHEN